MKPTLCTIAATLLLATNGLAAQAPPGDALRTLVGKDVGLCLEFHDLGTHRGNLRKSEFARRWRATKLFTHLKQSKPFREFGKFRAQIELLTGKPLPEFFDGLFGQSVVLAVYPSGKGEPVGVLITKASDRKTLDHALASWKRAEPKREARAITYRKREYIRFARKEDPKPLFLATLNDVFVLSDNEAAVQRVIRLAESPKGAADSLAKSKLYAEARKSIRGKPAATGFINPRAWDAALKIDGDSASSERIPAAIWRGCRWVMAGLRLDDGLVFDAVVQFDKERLPAASRKSFERIAGKPAFLDRVPADALIAVAGRFDPQGISNVLKTVAMGPNADDLNRMRKVAQALLGFDPVKDALPNLRPNYGFYLVGRSAKGGRVPFDGLAAVEINKDAPKARIETGLANVMRFLVTSFNLQAANNRQPLAAVKSRKAKALAMHWAESIATYRPAFGITERFLTFAGDPALIESFAGKKEKRLIDDIAFKKWRGRFFADHQQIAWLNVAALRKHMETNKSFFLKKWANAENNPQAGEKFSYGLEALGLIDGAFSAVHTGKARVRFTLGALTSQK